MKTALTIDSAGRVVLPSEARRLLNLRPGSRLRLAVVAERIELTPEPEDETATLIDTSFVVASLDPDEPHHLACDRALAAGPHKRCAHALAETFSILTGGRQGRRLRPAAAASLIEQSVLPYVQLVSLSGKEVMAAPVAAEARGARGGAVYDLPHLAAARKADVATLLTLDARDFQALAQPGDPRVESP